MNTQEVSPVLSVKDLDSALRFYTEVLGFQEDFRFGEYAGIRYGDVRIHISRFDNPNSKEPGAGSVYIYCDEIDTYHSAILDRGANIEAPPENQSYGMRDFIVHDPDGNQLCFGTECTQ